MSGFLSDIASWALGGGAGANNNDPNANANGQTTTNDATSVLTDDEMRAKRMARLAALENNAQKETDDSRGSGAVVAVAAANEAVSLDASSSMDVDDKPKSSSSTTNTKITTSSNPTTKNKMHPQPMDVDDDVKPTTVADNDVTMEESIPKKKIKSPPNTNATTPASTAATSAAVIAPLDPLAKLRRKKTLLLRRVLLVTFGDSSTSIDHRTSSSPSSAPLSNGNSSNNCVHLTLDDDEMYNPTKSPTGVQPHHIAELLTARLSLSPKAHCLERTVPSQSKLGLIGYLGGCYKRACEEWREMKHEVSGGGGKKMLKKEEEDGFEEMCAILEQIKDQVSVLYFREI
jgi:hypothetical protein